MIDEPNFLDLDQVLELHYRQIVRFGGSDGVRDLGLIQSAIAQPQMIFSGVYLHGTLFEMAGAYFYHLTKNHGFVDGNKRIGAVAALVFLEMNGVDTDHIDEAAMEAIALGVADGSVEKKAVAKFFASQIGL